MIKFFLYFVVLMAFIPLVSSGRIRPRAQRHVSELRDITGNPFLTWHDGAVDSISVRMGSRPPQDSLGKVNRKKIKEVARAKPQAKPEKIARRAPVDRPADPGAVRRPPARPATRPTARPAGGQGGTRPQTPPSRPGR